LLVAATLSTLIALVATGLVLNFLFRSFFEDRFHKEIEAYLVQLSASISISRAGEFQVSELSDPRFSEPLSGFYWQAQIKDQPPVVSQSFWSKPLEITRPIERNDLEFSSLSDANGEYIAGSWIVTLSFEGDDAEVFLTVALDKSEFARSADEFSWYVIGALCILGSFLIVAYWMQIRVGLKPLERIRSEVKIIKSARDKRLSDDYPKEVQPLVLEVNELLNSQEKSIVFARSRAADLAHGLKTPLTIMRSISQDLQNSNHSELATEIDNQVENMQYFVERELARTRDQNSEIAWCKVEPIVKKVVSAFQRSTANIELNWAIDAQPGLMCPFDEYTLTELLGNLIDNAMKWTRLELKIQAYEKDGIGLLSVTDDGPGISAAELENVVQRGIRLDNASQGQGLGLAIVNDMMEKRGGTLELKNAKPKGLSVKVTWPCIRKHETN
jgi:signal transduction histidine kinase